MEKTENTAVKKKPENNTAPNSEEEPLSYKRKKAFKYGCPRCGDLFIKWSDCGEHMKICCKEELKGKKRMRRCQLGHPDCVVPTGGEQKFLYSCPRCKKFYNIWEDCISHINKRCEEEEEELTNSAALKGRRKLENTQVAEHASVDVTILKTHDGNATRLTRLCNETSNLVMTKKPSTIANDELNTVVEPKFASKNTPQHGSSAVARPKRKRETKIIESNKVRKAKKRKKRSYGCPRCHSLFQTWALCYGHLKECCAVELLNRKGLQQRCMLEHARCVIPMENRSRNGSSSQTLRSPPPAVDSSGNSKPSETYFVGDIRTTNDSITSKETSKRRGISNLPAWMTRKSASSVENSISSAFETQQTFARLCQTGGDIGGTMGNPSQETSKRQGISNLPAWMTQKPASSSENTTNSTASETQQMPAAACQTGEKNYGSTTSASSLVQETSKRRGISNLPAWMTRKQSTEISEMIRSTTESKLASVGAFENKNHSVSNSAVNTSATIDETSPRQQTESTTLPTNLLFPSKFTNEPTMDTSTETNNLGNLGILEMNPLSTNNWESAIDSASNRVYFFNNSTGVSTWEYPESAFDVLPQAPNGWDTAIDEVTKQVYFFDIVTGKTSWEHPVHASS